MTIFKFILLVVLSSSFFSATAMAETDTLGACGKKPNCVSSVYSGAQQPQWFIEPLNYDANTMPHEEAYQKLLEILDEAGFEVVAEYPLIKAVAITKWMKFKDDMIFILDENTSRIQMRSESRKGYSDFGKNRKRLEKIRTQFQEKIH